MPIFTLFFRIAPALILGLGVTACSSVKSDFEEKGIRMEEEHLLEAGFKIMIADSKEKLQMLNSLPADTITNLPHGGQTWYVYPDPKVCSCLYVGREIEFRKLQKLAADRRLSDQYTVSHELAEDYQSGWGPQGVWGNFGNVMGGNNPLGHPDWDPQ
jgi:hypothetical protein